MRVMLSLALFLAIAAPRAHAQQEHVGRDAERGDPARWSEPADTPRKQFETAMKEADAAKAEAIRQCRGLAERAACESQARRQYEVEVQQARSRLARPGQETR